MTSAAIYARVSSARQKEQETIVSQTEALRAHARLLRQNKVSTVGFDGAPRNGSEITRRTHQDVLSAE
jgi:site-specific DNA recombinase